MPDSNYQNNAYVENQNWTIDSQPFYFPKLNEVVLTLAPGQVSDIIEIVSQKTLTEKLFAVVKLDNMQPGQFRSLRDWVKQATSEYPLTNQIP